MYRAPTKSLRSAFGRAGLKPRPYNRENRKSTGLRPATTQTKRKERKGAMYRAPTGCVFAKPCFRAPGGCDKRAG